MLLSDNGIVIDIKGAFGNKIKVMAYWSLLYNKQFVLTYFLFLRKTFPEITFLLSSTLIT